MDTNSANTTANLFTPVQCADVSVNKTVTPSAVQAGAAVTYTVTVTNSGVSNADAIAFSDPLPAGFLYTSVSCAPTTGSPLCPVTTFDGATKTIAATIAALASGDALTFTITGTAGTVPGTYANTATIAPHPGQRLLRPQPHFRQQQGQLADLQHCVEVCHHQKPHRGSRPPDRRAH